MSNSIATHTHATRKILSKPLTPKEKSNAFKFVFYTLLVMFLTGALAYYA